MGMKWAEEWGTWQCSLPTVLSSRSISVPTLGIVRAGGGGRSVCEDSS